MITGCIPGPQAPSAVDEIVLVASSERATDRVSPGNVPVADGVPDPQFTLTVSGPVASIILGVCNDGAATSSQWDTVVGDTPLPAGFVWRFGSETWVLGVYDSAGKLLNAGDGSLPVTDFPASTQLTLSAADNGVLAAGTTVCVWMLRPDGSSLRASTQVP